MNKIEKALFIITIALFLLNGKLYAQDTIRFMHYNLLYYGKKTDFCTTSNNNIDDKNQNLKTIIQYVKPDIFSVNELDGEAEYPISDDAQYLLDNALNVDGVNYYRKTDFPVAYLANTIFYNSKKLILQESDTIGFTLNGNYKAFNAYKFYFNSDDLETVQDTAYFICVVAHLKAGYDSPNPTQRAYESSLIMDYFESIGEQGNYLIMGDFNVYTPNEECFQNFINPDNSLYTFYDPADQIGEWSGNEYYKYYHTQSTHSSSNCFSGGGMDDRFDFILASDYIMNGTDHYGYIQDSYQIVGQDGSRYNLSLNTTSNSVVPNNVAQALYNFSDHLPVYMEMEVDQNLGEPVSFKEMISEKTQITINNPVDDKLKLLVNSLFNQEVIARIYSASGNIQLEKKLELGKGKMIVEIPVEMINPGLYIISLYHDNEIIFSDKLIIN